MFRVYYSSRLVFDHWSTTCVTSPSPERSRGTATDFSQPGNERSVWNWIWFHDGSRDDEKGYREERERRRRGGKRGPVQRLPGQEVSLFPSNDLHFRCPAFRLVLQVSSSRGNEKADRRAAAFPFFRRTSSSGGSLLRENLHRFLEQHHRRNCVRLAIDSPTHRSKNGRARISRRLNLKLNLRLDRITFILFDPFTIDLSFERNLREIIKIL